MSVSKWRRQYKKFKIEGNLGNVPDQILFAIFLKRKFRALKKSAQYSKNCARKNNAKRISRKIFLKVYKGYAGLHGPRNVVKRPELLLYKVKANLVRDKLSPNFMGRWRTIPQRIRAPRSAIITLENFSFARYPRGTLTQIRELVREAAICSDIRINFVDEKCDDVAPYIVLSQLMGSLPPVFSGGIIRGEVAAVIESVGIARPLGVRRIMGNSHKNLNVLPFEMVSRNPPKRFGDRHHQLKPQEKEQVADSFCDTLNAWLDEYDLELTIEAQQSLTNSITEALDNAERHGRANSSDQMRDWSMAGFSRLIEEPETGQQLRCSFAIVNVGVPISDSFPSASPEIQAKIGKYISLQHASNEERQKLLATVMALQDGITRVASASEAGRGGVGLMRLVDIFADLGENDDDALQSVFTILSGKSCLRITKPFQSGLAPQGSTMRELWFNKENSSHVAPDDNHVFAVPDYFSGTVLSACFTIERDAITRKLSAQEE